MPTEASSSSVCSYEVVIWTPSRSSRSTDPVRLLYARDPVLITLAPAAAPTKADAVDRLKVLGPPPVPTMFTVGAGGGAGGGVRSRSDCISALIEAPSGVFVVSETSTASASPGCSSCFPRRSQKSPQTSSGMGPLRSASAASASDGGFLGIRRLAPLVDEVVDRVHRPEALRTQLRLV